MAVRLSNPVATLTSTVAKALGALGGVSHLSASELRKLPINLASLQSDAGSELELQRAARTCALHGVQLWADIQLNHLVTRPGP